MTAERDRPPVRATFVCEATVGHVAFLQRLQAVAAGRSDLESTWFALGPDPEGVLERLPPFSSIWTARASLRARRMLDRQPSEPDALFFHTLAPSLLSNRWLNRIPTVISVDATPMNVDEVGAGYGHAVGPPPVEAAKKRLVRRAFATACVVVAWSEWVRRSLIDDYGIEASKVVVQPPGVALDRFRPSGTATSDRVRLLFVGGDFRRKGGEELLRLFSELPERCELDIVTQQHVAAGDRIRVHRGLGPDDPRLLRLYEQADVFVLPTRADTWGHAVVEAMASGLPVVTTPVGSLGEIVGDDAEGLIVHPGDAVGLGQALRRLVDDPVLRSRLGEAGRRKAVAQFDATANLNRILDLVSGSARPRPSRTEDR